MSQHILSLNYWINNNLSSSMQRQLLHTPWHDTGSTKQGPGDGWQQMWHHIVGCDFTPHIAVFIFCSANGQRNTPGCVQNSRWNSAQLWQTLEWWLKSMLTRGQCVVVHPKLTDQFAFWTETKHKLCFVRKVCDFQRGTTLVVVFWRSSMTSEQRNCNIFLCSRFPWGTRMSSSQQPERGTWRLNDPSLHHWKRRAPFLLDDARSSWQPGRNCTYSQLLMHM